MPIELLEGDPLEGLETPLTESGSEHGGGRLGDGLSQRPAQVDLLHIKSQSLKGHFQYMISRVASKFSVLVRPIKGPAVTTSNRNLRLGGLHIPSHKADMPTLIFIPELFDHPSSWVKFFMNPENSILNYRNVYVLNPRNVGNSDRNDEMNYLTMAQDINRFMYEHKISTTTIAGHGMGGKLALAFACLYHQKTTGYFGVDCSPMDNRYFQAFRELKGIVKSIKSQQFTSLGQGRLWLKENIKCPKWREIFTSRLVESKQGIEWDFNLNAIHHNLTFADAENLGNWPVTAGLFTGRAAFSFNQYSRWVYLNTNTIPMYKICLHVKPFGTGIRMIQGDENPLNHWIYDYPQQSSGLGIQMREFLANQDGVHILLANRSEVGRYAIPERHQSRDNPNHIYEQYIPAHFHHNWRFRENK